MANSYKIKKFRVPGYIKSAIKFLAPPEDLTVSEWAARYRVLNIKSSAMPGPWKNEVTPYLVDIMNEFNNYQTEKIVFCKATQVAGTEGMQNMLGFTAMQDPGPAMVVYPTDQLIERTVQTRLRPMIEDSPGLSKIYDKRRSGNNGIQFDNSFIALAGSNSPSGLASTPIRYLFLDEVDKYPSASRKEADPISLAIERTKTFWNRKIYMTSTPTLRTGQIWKAKEACDVERHFFVPCPQCGEMIELKFTQIKWPDKEDGLSDQDRAEQAYYVCQKCGCVLDDNDKSEMITKGEWHDVRKDTELIKSVAFWISSLYSPFVRFAEVALKFLESKDDPEKLQNFTNSWLAEPWEETKLKTSAELVLAHKTLVPEYVLPEWTKMLTGGIDVQENSKRKDPVPKEKALATKQFREMDMQVRAVEGDGNERTFLISFSSEEPYERYYGSEILSHDEGAVDLNRLNQIGVTLFNHDRNEVLGKIDRAWIEDNRGCAEITFDDDDDSEKIFQKVKNKTLKGVSVGYLINRYEEVNVGEISSNGRFQGPCTVATKWMPFEISIVSVPADASVGVGRELKDEIEPEAEERSAIKISLCENIVEYNRNLFL